MVKKVIFCYICKEQINKYIIQNTTLFGSNSCFKKHVMWYKVKELNSKGLKKTQIARELGIHHETVRRYLSFSESEFSASQFYRCLFIVIVFNFFTTKRLVQN